MLVLLLLMLVLLFPMSDRRDDKLGFGRPCTVLNGPSCGSVDDATSASWRGGKEGVPCALCAEPEVASASFGGSC
jgi:hypothetical protein